MIYKMIHQHMRITIIYTPEHNWFPVSLSQKNSKRADIIRSRLTFPQPNHSLLRELNILPFIKAKQKSHVLPLILNKHVHRTRKVRWQHFKGRKKLTLATSCWIISHNTSCCAHKKSKRETPQN